MEYLENKKKKSDKEKRKMNKSKDFPENVNTETVEEFHKEYIIVQATSS